MLRTDSEPPRKRRKEATITTNSLLEEYLLLKTAFDDTILRDELIEDLDIANGSGSGTSKTDKKKSLASHPALPYILKDLNEQRLDVRKKVQEAISAFAAAYDVLPLKDAKYDVQPDEQKALLQEQLGLKDAIVKLREELKRFSTEIGALEKAIRGHEKRMTRAVDAIVGKKTAGNTAVPAGADEGSGSDA